jgi:hypothetical protein
MTKQTARTPSPDIAELLTHQRITTSIVVDARREYGRLRSLSITADRF